MATSLRGVMLAPWCPLADVLAAEAAGVNLLRYNMYIPEAKDEDPAYQGAPRLKNSTQFNALINAHLAHIDTFLPSIQSKLIIELHHMAGGLNSGGEDTGLYKSNWAEVHIKTWERIAKKFATGVGPKPWAYEILNEPYCKTATPVNKFMIACSKRIRKIDKDVKIIVSPPYGVPDKLTLKLATGVPGTIYTCHMYAPGQITYVTNPVGYPSAKWAKAGLKAYLKPLRDFQKKYSAKIYIGEFSCSANNNVASRVGYLSDCISIFEEYGWDWSYHAWRENPMWSAEEYPEVLKVLTDAWDKN